MGKRIVSEEIIAGFLMSEAIHGIEDGRKDHE